MNDLELALEWSSMQPELGNTAYINRVTGDSYYVTESGDQFDEEPEDFDSEDWLAVPHKRELDLGSQLVFAFADTVADELAGQIRSCFERKGAYRRFRNVIVRAGVEDEWYAFERQGEHDALSAWAVEHGVVIT